jgi:hypothetical protein
MIDRGSGRLVHVIDGTGATLSHGQMTSSWSPDLDPVVNESLIRSSQAVDPNLNEILSIFICEII